MIISHFLNHKNYIMYELKKISATVIPRALEKVERYRLLNEPWEAESICRDILAIDGQNQQALIMLILSISDQFGTGVNDHEIKSSIPKLSDEYNRAYYTGIVKERQAKASLNNLAAERNFDAFEWLEEAMEAFEKAASLREEGNEDSLLRYNACVRTIKRYNLSPRPEESRETFLE
jgi:hypothetical protein